MGDAIHKKLRNAHYEDIPFLLNLFARSVRQVCAKDYSSEQIEAWVRTAHEPGKWEKRIDEQFFILLENNENEPMGFSSLRNDAYLDLLFVDPDWQSQGIASALVAEIRRKALADGHSMITTDASITAKPFFLRQGFTVVHVNEFELYNVPIHNYRMNWVY